MRFGVFPAAIVVFIATHARAQTTSPVTPRSDRALREGTTRPQPAAAHEHFERALTFYRAGKYRNAIAELDAALDSDAGGKDLVFNLALVQEKLGDLAGAIHSLERFQEMERDPAELDRAAQTIHRLEGARAELLADPPGPVPRVAPLPCPIPRPRGKFDAWVIGAGSLAVASWLAGIAFGVRVLTLDASADRGRARDAAVLADLGFATGLLAGAGAVALYFGRYADAPARPAGLTLPRVTAAHLELRF